MRNCRVGLWGRASRGGSAFRAAGAVAIFSAALMPCSEAPAESCSEQVERFGRLWGLATTLEQAQLSAGEQVDRPSSPMTAESRGVTDNDNARTTAGGVLRPPDAGVALGMTAPATGDRMQTGMGAHHEPVSPLDASTRMRAESLLMAALEEARLFRPDKCFVRLKEAESAIEGETRSSGSRPDN